jgi:hypothetical protein
MSMGLPDPGLVEQVFMRSVTFQLWTSTGAITSYSGFNFNLHTWKPDSAAKGYFSLTGMPQTESADSSFSQKCDIHSG